MQNYDHQLVRELYQVAHSLLWSHRAAEQAVTRACAVDGGQFSREHCFTILMREVIRRRRWTLSRVPRSFHANADVVLTMLRRMPSPSAEALVLMDVCGFDLPTAARILGLSSDAGREHLVEARGKLYESLNPAQNLVSARALHE